MNFTIQDFEMIMTSPIVGISPQLMIMIEAMAWEIVNHSNENHPIQINSDMVYLFHDRILSFLRHRDSAPYKDVLENLDEKVHQKLMALVHEERVLETAFIYSDYALGEN